MGAWPIRLVEQIVLTGPHHKALGTLLYGPISASQLEKPLIFAAFGLNEGDIRMDK